MKIEVVVNPEAETIPEVVGIGSNLDEMNKKVKDFIEREIAKAREAGDAYKGTDTRKVLAEVAETFSQEEVLIMAVSDLLQRARRKASQGNEMLAALKELVGA